MTSYTLQSSDPVLVIMWSFNLIKIGFLFLRVLLINIPSMWLRISCVYACGSVCTLTGSAVN
jgi:hypothetical protein